MCIESRPLATANNCYGLLISPEHRTATEHRCGFVRDHTLSRLPPASVYTELTLRKNNNLFVFKYPSKNNNMKYVIAGINLPLMGQLIKRLYISCLRKLYKQQIIYFLQGLRVLWGSCGVTVQSSLPVMFSWPILLNSNEESWNCALLWVTEL